MDLILNNNFSSINENELNLLNGGIDWDSVGSGIATTGGGYLGSKIGAKVGASIGTTGGPVGTVVGALIGGAAGAIIYSFWD